MQPASAAQTHADAETPRAVLFDAYGTLFDVYSVGELAEQLFAGHGESLSLLWRDKQIEYTRLTSMSGRYRPFSELTRAGLRHAARRLSLTLDAGAEARLLDEYWHLRAFAEAREVLVELHARGIPTGILSNGDPDMLDTVARHAGLGELLAHVLSAHALRLYKPDPAVYALGPRALDLAAKDILFVSSNGWDAIGATWFGYTTLWVNRGGLPLDELATEPTRTGSSLRDVLSFFED